MRATKGVGSLDQIASDAPGPLEALIAAEEAGEARPVYLVGSLAWLADPAAVAGYAGGPCPQCGESAPAPRSACLVCSATHTGRTRRPMQGRRPWLEARQPKGRKARRAQKKGARPKSGAPVGGVG